MSEDPKPEPNQVAYTAPKKITLDEINGLDAEDESLRKYKESLLVPDDPRIFIPMVIKVISDDKVLTEMQISSETKEKPTVELAEGTKYHLEIEFYVQREICSGIKLVHQLYKGPLRADKDFFMLGSFPPKQDLQKWRSPECETPKGFLLRGQYSVKSTFEDDDKNQHCKLDWTLVITKSNE